MDVLAAAILERLTFLHDSMKTTLAALPDEAIDWSPAADVNSVAVLLTHVAGSERFWFGEKVGGISAQRDRSAEFKVLGADRIELVALLDAALGLAAQVMERLAPSDLSRPAGVAGNGAPYDVAWALQHALEHVAVHTGHVELMRQWWENRAS
ncbi:MAG: DUF1572 domain-containing protein [Caldilinea sp.]|nr:DUF1572 family protein [Caldilinea sp.]MCB0060036.1 DUF1572 family protein [Caldilineaceae bacterium]MCB0038631.1 DUF1572 family protein [Caldilinea sp.]MCB0048996.1 DUF1572 family protein [Caldilinea sp.]MCB0067530.1 DUF1572 family protein [Caldilineaceae bacterium]